MLEKASTSRCRQLLLPCDSMRTTVDYLLRSISSLLSLFWVYFQLTCLQWKHAVSGYSTPSDAISWKLKHSTHVTICVYEQCPADDQNLIIDQFHSKTDVIRLCGKLAIAAVKGEVYGDVKQWPDLLSTVLACYNACMPSN